MKSLTQATLNIENMETRSQQNLETCNSWRGEIGWFRVIQENFISWSKGHERQLFYLSMLSLICIVATFPSLKLNLLFACQFSC